LYQRGVDEIAILQAKSEILGYPVKSLTGVQVPFEVLREIPEESARYYQFVPIGAAGDDLEIGMVHPDDVSAQQALKFISARLRKAFKVYLITPSDFNHILSEYKSIGGEVTKALTQFEQEAKEEGLLITTEDKDITKGIINEDAPIAKIVDVIIKHGVDGRASDIHIEPTKEGVRVRFRLDGVLFTSINLPGSALHAIINRIKILTKMKIDETRVPQDGRFHARVGSKDVDFRVATLPTPYGEKVAIRILDPDAGVKTLADLGFIGRNLEMVQTAIRRPYGMILITGPTGSGKSTTLYALLQILNREGVNIISLEDPIEYYIDGMNQSQIRPEIGYDFATGLRNILRQDPDIIMVGEIRDKETAQLAIQAALTGHLVLSTLHTNNAIGVIPRLIDMGVDPFLLPSTLIMTIAQRLVRKLCPDSRAVIPEGALTTVVQGEVDGMPEKYKQELLVKKPFQIYQGVVSPACPKGTSGRMGIYETLFMTPELEKIIIDNPSENRILEEAKRQQMLTMRQDGIIKVLNGIIGVQELLEVV
jgi:type IV pilus assembly protein PilB